LPQEKWLKVESRQDLVFFEGWFLGFKAKDTTLPDAHLDEINERLKSYEPIYPQLDGFCTQAKRPSLYNQVES
jgi:pantothenate kinase-related protein Tda10